MGLYEQNRAKPSDYFLVRFLVAVFGIALGYYLLAEVSTQINPVFGNTFHIVIGCSLMASGAIVLLLSIKKKFIRKKKSRKSKVVFLKK